MHRRSLAAKSYSYHYSRQVKKKSFLFQSSQVAQEGPPPSVVLQRKEEGAYQNFFPEVIENWNAFSSPALPPPLPTIYKLFPPLPAKGGAAAVAAMPGYYS